MLDRTGRQAFGERLYLTSFERVQEMAWTIGECYDIELNMAAYTSIALGSEASAATLAQPLQTLSICDHRNN